MKSILLMIMFLAACLAAPQSPANKNPPLVVSQKSVYGDIRPMQPSVPDTGKPSSSSGNGFEDFLGSASSAIKKSYSKKTKKTSKKGEMRRNLALGLKTFTHGALMSRHSYDPAVDSAGFMGELETQVLDIILNRIIDVVVKNTIQD